MAEENREQVGQNNGVTKSETVGERTEKNPSTETPADGGTGRGRGRRRKTTDNSESGTATGTAEEKKLSGVALVSSDTESSVPQPEPKKAKRRRTRTTKKNDTALNAEQITAFLMALSAVFSASEKESTKVFALSESEAQQLAEPLAKLITNNDNIKEIVEKSDNVSLALACAMVFLPKLFIFIQLKKNEKVLRDKNVKFLRGEKIEQKRTTTGSNSGDNSRQQGHTPDNVNSTESVLSSIPSIA